MARRNIKRSEEYRNWFISHRTSFESLTKIVCGTLEGLLKERKIDYLSVNGRAKQLESFLGKISRKKYKDPARDIHDLAGIRIIAFIESDVRRIIALIKDSFHVHADKSLDKSAELGIDRAGYRSVHLVCDFGQQRASLPEYIPYKNMLFEIQVRTVLQHAWAEIEHDRNYKFSGILPQHLQRRLNLAAGTLEMVDHEFDALAKAIDDYGHEVLRETRKGNLEISINTTSLSEYLKAKFAKDKFITDHHLHDVVISELINFGTKTLDDLEALITTAFLNDFRKTEQRTTSTGFLRSAMMYADPERYFKTAWQKNWSGMGPKSCDLLEMKHGSEKMRRLLRRYEIDSLDFDDDYQEPDE